MPVVLAAGRAFSWHIAALSCIALLVPALVRTAVISRDLWKTQTLGDRLLRSHPAAPLSPLAAWRARELTSPRTRSRSRRLVRGLRRESEASLGSGLSPAEEAAVRRSIALLQQLEGRLASLSEPVSPRGILAVAALVVGGNRWSPLYFPERSLELADALDEAVAAL